MRSIFRIICTLSRRYSIYFFSFLLLSKFLFYNSRSKQRRKLHFDPSKVLLHCGAVNLEGSANLFEARDRLSCNNTVNKHNMLQTLLSPAYLHCHAADSNSFEPINTYEALSKYKTFTSCDFSTWLRKNSLEYALKNIDQECAENMMHDRPLENCEIHNVMFENETLVGVSSSSSTETIFFPNLITIERRVRRRYKGVKDFSVRKFKPTTIKLPIKLVPLGVFNRQCRSRLNGITILIRRWHPDSLYHLIESLFRLYKTMKFHKLLDIPTRIVNLDLLEGKQTTFMGNTFKRNGLDPTGKYKYAELLEAFGESIYHMDMFQETPVCFEHVVVVGFSSHSLGAFEKNNSELAEFKDFLLKKLKLDTREVKKDHTQQITLLSRSNLLGYGEKSLQSAVKRRHILNEEDIALYLLENSGKKVEIVKMNELNIHDQILLMFRTQILISIHSAALINMLWMKPGSGVVQIHVEGTHLGTIKMLTRNHFLVRECGIPFHMLAHVESMASSLKLKYNEVIVGGKESKKNKDLQVCEEGKKFTYSCCKIFEKEEYSHRFANDFFLEKKKVWDSIKFLLH